MKPREILTAPIVIVSNYKITVGETGEYLHQFTPKSTSTQYMFFGPKEPLLINGERYNIGYRRTHNQNIVDMSFTCIASEVNPKYSHLYAKEEGGKIAFAEISKSDCRVAHDADDGHYLGRKYAWRIYGMALSRKTFDDYLGYIKHPRVSCFTDGSRSFAYLNDGIDTAIDYFIDSCERVGKSSNRFKSKLFPIKKWFNVKAVNAITDRK
jgi:hypothetical protein